MITGRVMIDNKNKRSLLLTENFENRGKIAKLTSKIINNAKIPFLDPVKRRSYEKSSEIKNIIKFMNRFLFLIK